MGQQSRCSNYRPKVGPGNNYISFHGQAPEAKTRSPAGYLRGLDPFFLFFQVWHLNPWRLEADFPDWRLVYHSEAIMKIKVGLLTAVICGCFVPLWDRLTKIVELSVLLCFLSFPTGYNTVVRIPAGATNIDIKQVSYSGKPEDDNYLGECAACVCQWNDVVLSNTVSNCRVFLGNSIQNGSRPN